MVETEVETADAPHDKNLSSTGTESADSTHEKENAASESHPATIPDHAARLQASRELLLKNSSAKEANGHFDSGNSNEEPTSNHSLPPRPVNSSAIATKHTDPNSVSLRNISHHTPPPQPSNGATSTDASRVSGGRGQLLLDDSATSARESGRSFASTHERKEKINGGQSLEKELEELHKEVDTDASKLKDLEDHFRADLERVSKGLDLEEENDMPQNMEHTGNHGSVSQAAEQNSASNIDMNISKSSQEDTKKEQSTAVDPKESDIEAAPDFRRRTLEDTKPSLVVEGDIDEEELTKRRDRNAVRRSRQFNDLSELSASTDNFMRTQPPFRSSDNTAIASNKTKKPVRSALRTSGRFEQSSVGSAGMMDNSLSEYEADLSEFISPSRLSNAKNRRLAPESPEERVSTHQRGSALRSSGRSTSSRSDQDPPHLIPKVRRSEPLPVTREEGEERRKKSKDKRKPEQKRQLEDEDLDSEEEAEAEYQKRSLEMCVSCGCLCLVIILFNGLGVLLTKIWVNNDDADAVADTIAPSFAPSLAPATETSLFLLPFPELTQLAIEQNPGSPENRAYLWLEDDPLLDSYTAHRLLQRFALATFYFSTFGEAWSRNTNWLSYEEHECDWYKSAGEAPVTICNEHDEYIALLLSQNGLTGTLPRELALLDSLEVIDVSENAIGGTFPEQIGLLINLKELLINGNEIQGLVPTEVGQLNRLKTLKVRNNSLSGIIPTELGSLVLLETLEWSRTKTGGSLPTELGLLRNIISLDLGRNLLEGAMPSEIFSMTNLRQDFVLHWNKLTGTVPTEIGQLSSASRIYLGHNDLHGAIPSEVGLLRNSTSLALNFNNLRDAIPTEIGQLLSMESLNLCCNSLTGQLPSEFGLLKNLTFLDIDINRLSKSIPVEVPQNLGELKSLSMKTNQLSGTIPTEFGLMTSLKALYLDWNRFTGVLPSEIGSLADVEEIWMDYNSLTGQLPSELADMSSLNVLRLSFNYFSGQIPEEYGLLSENLEGLGLERTSLTGAIPPGLCGIAQLNVTCSNSLCGCYCFCLGL